MQKQLLCALHYTTWTLEHLSFFGLPKPCILCFFSFGGGGFLFFVSRAGCSGLDLNGAQGLGFRIALNGASLHWGRGRCRRASEVLLSTWGSCCAVLPL